MSSEGYLSLVSESLSKINASSFIESLSLSILQKIEESKGNVKYSAFEFSKIMKGLRIPVYGLDIVEEDRAATLFGYPVVKSNGSVVIFKECEYCASTEVPKKACFAYSVCVKCGASI